MVDHLPGLRLAGHARHDLRRSSSFGCNLRTDNLDVGLVGLDIEIADAATARLMQALFSACHDRRGDTQGTLGVGYEVSIRPGCDVIIKRGTVLSRRVRPWRDPRWYRPSSARHLGSH